MKFEGIQAFVAIAESGSISAAARRLDLSTSVVSERLSRLEESLGVALMQRTTRKLTLTEDGTTFLERARGILSEVENARVELAERRGGLAGPLRISAPVSFGMLHLGPALYRFMHEHPKVEITLDLDDRFVDPASDGFDAVIRIGNIADRRLTAKVLAPSRRLMVASPAYLDANGTPQTLEDLRNHAAILYSLRGGDDWQFSVRGKPVVVKPKAALTVNNGDVMRDAAEAGLGLSLLPSFIVADSVAAGRLKRVEVGADVAADSLQIAHVRRVGIPQRVGALVDFLSESFGPEPYWDREIANARKLADG